MRRPAGIVTRSFSASMARPSPPARAPLPPSSAPSAARLGHAEAIEVPRVDLTAFRTAWRVSTRLDGLLEAGRIDREAWDAGHHWRRWAEMTAPYRAQRWDVRVDISTVPNDAAMLRRVTAATKLRQAAEALGPLRVKILTAVVVEDMPWTELGRSLRLSDKAAREWAAEALEALADHLAGRRVAPPPLVRFRNQPGSL